MSSQCLWGAGARTGHTMTAFPLISSPPCPSLPHLIPWSLAQLEKICGPPSIINLLFGSLFIIWALRWGKPHNPLVSMSDLNKLYFGLTQANQGLIFFFLKYSVRISLIWMCLSLVAICTTQWQLWAESSLLTLGWQESGFSRLLTALTKGLLYLYRAPCKLQMILNRVGKARFLM